MRRKESVHLHKHKHVSNRHLAERYYYAGEHETVTNIRLTQYNATNLHTRNLKTDETSFRKLADANSINWFQVSGLTDSEAITRIVNEFGMHNLDAKDILTPQHVVKIEEYDKHILIILNSTYYDANIEINTEHISILITGNVVISFTESNNPVFESTYKALESDTLNIRKRNSGLLLAFLLNTIIANLVESASKVEEMLEDIEETLLDIKNDQGNMGQLIQQRRKEYMIIRKNSQPLKEQFAKLLRTENGIIAPDALPIYNDLSDQLQFIIQTTESCREIISSLVDLYISNNDLRMNAIMKRLTVVSTIFIPLTFLAGIWGMNFKSMPELDWRYGYGIAWSLMLLTAVLTWLYMRKKDWF
ncbi:magnesium/cobalt transporter CorA [uncultured Parabacteroides sp.]|uniref:magnesium/cobalt transporter CorA n=1 Tax=uncultured Parabacteroides sp. TaxID=512312 RepID=UPI0025F3724D|nr:magnesium/cobalt transporter CorA [uncultured Parabacteroides sp.]